MSQLQHVIYEASRVLLWPVLIAIIMCLIWVLAECGILLYELYLRFRYRDLEALEANALKARKAFADGKPRTAYRYLQQNAYSVVVVRFLFDLIRNYQTQRLAAKPLKLLQEYEFYTIKRLERTRILVRLGPILGLMGTLIPLSPALVGLAQGNLTALASNLVTAFSVTVLGLLVGGLAFIVSIVRDRMYSQDISDMEYLLELLEGQGGRLQAGRRLSKKGEWDESPDVEYTDIVKKNGDKKGVAAEADAAALATAAALAELEPDEEGEDALTGVIDFVPVAASIYVRPVDAPDWPAVAGPAGASLTPAAAAPSATAAPAAPAESVTTAPGQPARPPAGALPSEQPGAARRKAGPALFDDPEMDWTHDDDPFADLGPADADAPKGRPADPPQGR